MPLWYDFENQPQFTCPRRPILDNPTFFNKVLDAYAHYEKGYMPETGGLNNQHCMYPDLMLLTQRSLNECDNRARESENKKPKSDGKVSLFEGR